MASWEPDPSATCCWQLLQVNATPSHFSVQSEAPVSTSDLEGLPHLCSLPQGYPLATLVLAKAVCVHSDHLVRNSFSLTILKDFSRKMENRSF